MKNKLKDHLGNEFDTLKAMCEYHNVPTEVYYQRLKKGLSLEELLKPYHKRKNSKTKGKKCVDHLGNEYDSISAMCRKYNINSTLFRMRRKLGDSVERALRPAAVKGKGIGQKCVDHLGNEYRSVKSMCDHYQIRAYVLKYRLEHGYTLEQALTTPTKALKNK